MKVQYIEKLRLTGYFPGVIGKITELHAVYYNEYWGFDISFETQVARELALFMTNFKNGRDGFWAAVVEDRFAGAIAIDGSQSSTEGARLRWFIVAPELQGNGIGAKLIGSAVDFCRTAGHDRVFLWTFRGLDSARKLYEKAGFRITDEAEIDQWGAHIVEQRFELALKLVP